MESFVSTTQRQVKMHELTNIDLKKAVIHMGHKLIIASWTGYVAAAFLGCRNRQTRFGGTLLAVGYTVGLNYRELLRI